MQNWIKHFLISNSVTPLEENAEMESNFLYVFQILSPLIAQNKKTIKFSDLDIPAGFKHLESMYLCPNEFKWILNFVSQVELGNEPIENIDLAKAFTTIGPLHSLVACIMGVQGILDNHNASLLDDEMDCIELPKWVSC